MLQEKTFLALAQQVKKLWKNTRRSQQEMISYGFFGSALAADCPSLILNGAFAGTQSNVRNCKALVRDGKRQ